jgi:hypothetical protein
MIIELLLAALLAVRDVGSDRYSTAEGQRLDVRTVGTLKGLLTTATTRHAIQSSRRRESSKPDKPTGVVPAHLVSGRIAPLCPGLDQTTIVRSGSHKG